MNHIDWARHYIENADDCLKNAIKRFNDLEDKQGAEKSQEALNRIKEIKIHIEKRGE